MQIVHYSLRNTVLFAVLILGLLLLSGCGTSAPVQEMSNARQAVQAARDAGAEQFALQTLNQAETLLREASRGIEQGDYRGAREHALAAREVAAHARVVALDATPDAVRPSWGF